MNLHGIVAGAIGQINPMVLCKVQKSNGSTIASDGTRTPTYLTFYNVQCQFQPLANRDIQRLGALNLQAIGQVIYLNGQLDGLNRVSQTGGDLVTEPNGSVWLTTVVLEDWDQSGWCRVNATLQNGS